MNIRHREADAKHPAIADERRAAGSKKPAGPPLYGVIDVLRPDRVAGWVIDRRDPLAHATVEIRREGQPVASVPANRARKDLAVTGVGTGAYGFSVPLTPALDDGMEFTLTVRAVASDGAEVLLRPAGRLGAPTGEQRALARLLGDVATCRSLLAAHATEAALLSETLSRIEVVQARLESAGTLVDMRDAPAKPVGLWVLAASGCATAVFSLGLATWSLWLQ